MRKLSTSPKFRRASMIGVGLAGAFAIAVPSIAWAVGSSPSADPVEVAVVVSGGGQELTHEEICAQAPVALSSLSAEELETVEPALEMTEATPALEGGAYEPAAAESLEGEASEAGGMTPAFSC